MSGLADMFEIANNHNTTGVVIVVSQWSVASDGILKHCSNAKTEAPLAVLLVPPGKGESLNPKEFALFSNELRRHLPRCHKWGCDPVGSTDELIG